MSSTPSRRSHEDGGNGSGSANHSHPSALKHPHDDQGTYPGKVVMPTRHDYHAPHDMAQDSRMTKTASRDSDRRLPLAPNSLPRASNDAHPDHIASETKEVKVERRDMKSDSRELQQSVNRVDDGKDAKHEKDSEMKVDKDVYSGSNNQSSHKEQYRVKQYPDGPGEAVKEGLHGEERESKDKDRKRKDMKHRDWGERDKERNDRRINVQGAVGSGGENKEALREERDSERMVVEKKDPLREKEKLTEKIQFKREALEKDGKESVNPPGKSVEHEFSEHKKKDYESWKNAERESKERKKERDTDVEPERPDKRGKFHEKESEECAMETEGGLEKEREAFNSGVQQRKRMLRPRGSPQTGNRIKPHTTDTEGPLGSADVCVVYKAGECLKDLTKLWREYKLSKVDRAGGESSQEGPTVEIRIPAEHVTATNRQVRGGQLWGTDVYTFDSDLVAVLMHTGFCRPTASPPPSGTQELRATIRVLPPQECYVSTLRNNVRSRAWGAAIGCSYRVEKCCIVKKEGGGRIDIEPCLTHSSTMEPTLAPVSVERTMTTRAAASNALRQQRFLREVTIQFNLCNEPWLKYSISAVADKGLKRNQFTSARVKKGEVLYVETHTRRYELCFSGEKLVKSAAAQTSASGAENGKSQAQNSNHSNGEKNVVEGEHTLVDVYRWSLCKKPIPQRKMLSMGIPLPRENVEVIMDDLEWESIAWTQTGVKIGDKEYNLVRAHFLAPN